MRTTARLATLLMLTSLFAACGSDGLDDDYSVEAALKELPAVGEDGFVTITTADLDGLSEAADLPSPQDDPRGWARALSTKPIFVPLPPNVANFEIAVGEPADPDDISFQDVASFAVLEDGGSGDEVRRLEVYRVEGESSKAPVGLEARTDGDLLAIGTDDEVLDDWEDDSSATDDDDLLALARALDDHDVYAATLSRLDGRTGNTDLPDFTAVGIGRGLESGAEVEYVAYVVDDPKAAVEAFEEVWGNESEVELVDVVAEGDTVVVQVRSNDEQDLPAPALRLLGVGAAPYDS